MDALTVPKHIYLVEQRKVLCALRRFTMHIQRLGINPLAWRVHIQSNESTIHDFGKDMQG